MRTLLQTDEETAIAHTFAAETPMERPFFHLGGTMSPDSPSYVERVADKTLLDALLQNELCLVFAPRQSGKSSLMIRVYTTLRTMGVCAVTHDFQTMGGSQTDADSFFFAFARRVATALKLQTDVRQWWRENNDIPCAERVKVLFEEVVLPETGDSRSVIFLDEVDSILKLPFADDFFTTIRALYNARAHKPELNRVTFALLGQTTPSRLIRDRERTPFNVGTQVALQDFTTEQLARFGEEIGDDTKELVNRIFYWTSGQPYLVQQLAHHLYELPHEQRTIACLDEFVRERYIERRGQDKNLHLQPIRNYLLDGENPFPDRAAIRKWLLLYHDLLDGKEVAENAQSPTQARLRLAGVARVENERLVPRCCVYSDIFNRDWIAGNLPQEETADTPLQRWLDSGRDPRFLLHAKELFKAEKNLHNNQGEERNRSGG